jgi:hypothetical protein
MPNMPPAKAAKAKNSGPKHGLRDKVAHHGKYGAAYRIRTYDPRITNAMLYQLS